MRKIERHHSGEGSVIYYRHFGKPSKLFVADAKWRDIVSLTSPEKPISSSRAFSLKKFNLLSIIDWERKASSSHDRYSHFISDRKLWKQFAPLKGDFTAKENTDLLMKYDSEAARMCRIIGTYELGRFDLPTLYQLMIIYQEADRIDALDPTVENFSMFALGLKGTYGDKVGDYPYGGAWSSTISGTGIAFSLNEFGEVNGIHLNSDMFGVIPVKEL